MKKLTVIAAAAALALAGCGAGEPPKPEAYPTMAGLRKAMDDAQVECAWEDAYPVLPSRVAAYRECVAPDGGVSAAVLFDSADDRVTRLEQFRSNASWTQKRPAILVGPNWHIECDQSDVCEQWRADLGGEVRSAPNY